MAKAIYATRIHIAIGLPIEGAANAATLEHKGLELVSPIHGRILVHIFTYRSVEQTPADIGTCG